MTVNSSTLGLKSKVSDARRPFLRIGTLLNWSMGYELTVNTSPVSLDGTVNLSNITLTLLEGTFTPSLLTILE